MARWATLLVAVLLALAVRTSAGGQKPAEKSAEKTGEKQAAEKKEEKKAPEEKAVQTKHAMKIGGQEIKYTATAGTILLKLEDGTPKASVFYIAYTKEDCRSDARSVSVGAVARSVDINRAAHAD